VIRFLDTVTEIPSLAPGQTHSGLRALFRQHGGEFRLANQHAVNQGAAFVPPHVAAPVDLRHVKFNPVPGQDRLAEFRLVDAHEINERRLLAGAVRVDAQYARGLRHAFDEQDPGHDRALRKMSLELRLVDADILDADAGLVTLRRDHPVYHQKGIAVGQGI
jgi:hypothetical protein